MHVREVMISEFRVLRACPAGENVVSVGILARESERSALRFLILQREEFHPKRIYLAVSAPD